MTSHVPIAIDEQLADDLISRLNALLEDEPARLAIAALIKHRIPVPDDMIGQHPTIQVGPTETGGLDIGFLGLLNGIIGVMFGGKFDQWGHITARFEADGSLVGFERTGSQPDVTEITPEAGAAA